MTIEELLECSADQLEKMTDAEIEAHFKPLLSITRPDLAAREAPKSLGTSPRTSSKKHILSEREQQAKEIAAKLGIDIGDLFQ